MTWRRILFIKQKISKTFRGLETGAFTQNILPKLVKFIKLCSNLPTGGEYHLNRVLSVGLHLQNMQID
jgi:hypothetical protein